MLLRIASALILVPAVLCLVYFSTPTIFVIALAAVGTLCLWEYLELFEAMGLPGQALPGYLGLWILFIGAHLRVVPIVALLAGILVGCFLFALARRDAMQNRVTGLTVTLTGVFFIGLSLYSSVGVRFDFGSERGVRWIIVLLGVIWAGDIGSLFVGKTIGRSLLAPRISPNKTNAGAVGGLLSSVLVAAALQTYLFPELPRGHTLVLAALLGTAGQLGDLSESMLKRAAEKKDSSSLIPGHGGVLDRVDSLLFALPVQYAYLSCLYGAAGSPP